MAGRIPKDIRNLVQQAQQVQIGLKKVQEELAAKAYTGTGGAAPVPINGLGELSSVEFDPAVLGLDDPEMLGDLLVVAMRRAKCMADDDAAAAMGGLAGGLGLGGLLE